MKSAPKHELEALRIDKLNEYEVLDTEAEAAFDELTQLASEICRTPISLISLVDPDRQWFKSKVGLDADETSRDIAFCSHAILQDHIFEVTDTKKDDRFHDNPLVDGYPNIRFYAGYPLKSPEGLPIGTLCVIDEKPKKLEPHQRRALEIISNQVIGQLELRLKTRKLERANQFKTDFLSNMSHEIRTPLNAIIGFSDVLLNNETQYLKSDEAKNFVRSIDFSGKHLLSMINTVLDLSKIEAGKMPVNPETFNVHDRVESIVEILQMKAASQGITLKAAFQSVDSYEICLDAPKLAQIIINLVNNAIKFSEPETTIEVGVNIKQDKLSLIISDQGIGIAPEQLAKVFDKYHQVGSKKVHGTGLGLSITKALVELMQGSIKIDSEVGKGTTVTINLPTHLPESNKVTSNDKLSALTLPENLQVLVVEDNQVNQTLINALLKNLKCHADIVTKGEEGVDACIKKSGNYDLILMDINLPGIDGFEATRQIKSQFPNAKVAALSADVFSESENNELFDLRLAKPITIDGLKNGMLSLLGK